MDSVLASSAVDHGFIGGVMDGVLECGRSWIHRWCNGWSAVDRGFIGGVMDSVLECGRSWIRATIGSNKSL